MTPSLPGAQQKQETAKMNEIKANLAEMSFAWNGPTTNGSRSYFRVQRPSLAAGLAVRDAPRKSTSENIERKKQRKVENGMVLSPLLTHFDENVRLATKKVTMREHRGAAYRTLLRSVRINFT